MKPAVRDFLLKHAGRNPVSFHMPGHKGAEFYRRFGYEDFLRDFPDFDITEIPGADNLFQPEGIIACTMEKFRKLYDAKASHLLINGTSGGIIASILACVPRGSKLIMARNCHKSVFNALTLGEIEPVYAYPEMIGEYGIAGGIDPQEIEKLLEQEPAAEAVILPSPNYYGVCSDIDKIAGIVHNAGKILIVDQAHGAHLKFFEGRRAEKRRENNGPDPEGNSAKNGQYMDMPRSAESEGADIVINSTHKTLGSLTQSAVLNLCSDRVDRYTLEDRLQAIQSTSPSYILMASLDICADIMEEHGEDLIRDWKENLLWFYEEAGTVPGLKVMKGNSCTALDSTKINLDMSECGLDGARLEEELLRRGIVAELYTGKILMCMSGVGNSREDYQKLIEALKEVSAERNSISKKEMTGEDRSAEKERLKIGMSESVWFTRRKLHPVEGRYTLLPLDQCSGMICGTSLIPYPPGIPLICPGEEITADDIEFINRLRQAGEKVIGLDQEGRIAVYPV